VADIQNYATGGVDILMFDSHSALPRIVLQVSCQLRVLLTPHHCRCKLGKRKIVGYEMVVTSSPPRHCLIQ
jgi:hypothetical protein